MRRAVFLDRDGVINALVYNPDFGLVDSPANPEEFCILPGVAGAIKLIHEMGYLVIVVSNQPGIAKGKFNHRLLDLMTDKMHHELAAEGAEIDAVYYCLHHPNSIIKELRQNCDCRKPEPGLLRRAATDLDIDLEHSFMIGDGLTDMRAGQSAGCVTIFINDLKCYICAELEKQCIKINFISNDLETAVHCIRNIEWDANPSRSFIDCSDKSHLKAPSELP